MHDEATVYIGGCERSDARRGHGVRGQQDLWRTWTSVTAYADESRRTRTTGATAYVDNTSHGVRGQQDLWRTWTGVTAYADESRRTRTTGATAYVDGSHGVRGRGMAYADNRSYGVRGQYEPRRTRTTLRSTAYADKDLWRTWTGVTAYADNRTSGVRGRESRRTWTGVTAYADESRAYADNIAIHG
ncbi:hypothetical protein DFH27DRAFT_618625, partial [Peziza echinospora]